LIVQVAHNWPPLFWLALATRSKNLLNQPFFLLGLEFLEVLLFVMTVTLASDEIRFEIRGKTVIVENTLVV
jgi:hypothetical protein